MDTNVTVQEIIDLINTSEREELLENWRKHIQPLIRGINASLGLAIQKHRLSFYDFGCGNSWVDLPEWEEEAHLWEAQRDQDYDWSGIYSEDNPYAKFVTDTNSLTIEEIMSSLQEFSAKHNQDYGEWITSSRY